MRKATVGVLVAWAFVLVVVGGHVFGIGPFGSPRWTNARTGFVADPHDYQDSTIPHQTGGCGGPVLEFLGGRYVDDPGTTVSEDRAASSFSVQATLPSDAVYTGWHRGDGELWLSPSSRRHGLYEAIFMRLPDHVERWPQSLAGGCDWGL